VDVLRPSFPGRSITSLARRPYPYATSFALDEVVVGFGDGRSETLILKDLAWTRLLDGARRCKPAFLYEPRREIATHLRLLPMLGEGPRCYGAVADAATARYWMLLERVDGVELWQAGETETWERVAAWLGRFHRRSSAVLAGMRAANPFLLDLDAGWFRSWCGRARSALHDSDDPRADALRAVLGRYDAVVDELVALPRAFVHGELYPSNVLVADGGARVCPVDWEMAATGPALIDLAAVVGGWDGAVRARLLAAYASEWDGERPPTPSELDCCRLHLALQWLGWAPAWEAPVEHLHDWIGEAAELAETLDL
jgi:Ser/Thr protein kinase RdoA (MazF antagonist)